VLCDQLWFGPEGRFTCVGGVPAELGGDVVYFLFGVLAAAEKAAAPTAGGGPRCDTFRCAGARISRRSR
jgi:hypothetical protein